MSGSALSPHHSRTAPLVGAASRPRSAASTSSAEPSAVHLISSTEPGMSPTGSRFAAGSENEGRHLAGRHTVRGERQPLVDRREARRARRCRAHASAGSASPAVEISQIRPSRPRSASSTAGWTATARALPSCRNERSHGNRSRSSASTACSNLLTPRYLREGRRPACDEVCRGRAASSGLTRPAAASASSRRSRAAPRGCCTRRPCSPGACTSC